MPLSYADAFFEEPAIAYASEETQTSGKILAIKLNNDMSLEELITSYGYTLDDSDVPSFISEFYRLNSELKSISLIKNGTSVRIPLKYLKKTKVAHKLVSEKKHIKQYAGIYEKRKVMKKGKTLLAHEEPVLFDWKTVLGSIELLFRELREDVSIENEALKVFNINEKSEIILDTAQFPIINLHNTRLIVLDLKNQIPEELRNLLEIMWPEYRFITATGKDIRPLIAGVLQSAGYSLQYTEKVIAGGSSQIEYHPDFLIYKGDEDLINSEIILVSIIGSNQKVTPESLKKWFMGREIQIIELAHEKAKKNDDRSRNDLLLINNSINNKEFTEKLLNIFGYNFEKNRIINISGRKEYVYNFRSDLSINLGYRTKMIEFEDLSDYEISYMKKMGFDVTVINNFDNRRDIAKKIVSLLSINHSSNPKRNSLYITPKGTRYSIISSGIITSTLKGSFFITDSELEPELLKDIVEEKITVVKF